MIKKYYNNIKFLILRVFYNKFKIQKNNKIDNFRLFNKKKITLIFSIFGSNNKLTIDPGSRIENLCIKIKGKK